uniref:DNA-directed DNA polymerase n=1 Tax=Meloidogyne enterolobii TaxID=390850 RepID=A0A6V7XD18_MELEN|nr:unnamed protein product [Meloidogyne enterolobii]
MLNLFLRVAQSKRDQRITLWGQPFSVIVTTLNKQALPDQRELIGGNPRGLAPAQHKISKKHLIEIKNKDSCCLFYALTATLVYNICAWPRWMFFNYKHSRKSMANKLSDQAKELMEKVGAPFDKNGYDAREWVPKVVDKWNEEYRAKYRIKVFIFGSLGNHTPYYKYGPDNFDTPVILYYRNNKHFDGVSHSSGLFGKPYCLSCETTYLKARDHTSSCRARCILCSRTGPAYPCTPSNNFDKKCSSCRKTFRNNDCFDHHNTSGFCKRSKKCEQCGVIWRVVNSTRVHVCANTFCNICCDYHDQKRGCFIRPLKPRQYKPYRIIAFDLETTQNKSIGNNKWMHEPNFIAVKISCPACISTGNWKNNNTDCSICGENRTITFSHQHYNNTHADQKIISSRPIRKFVKWLLFDLSKKYDTIAFSHFGGRFDMIIVFKEIFLHKFNPEMLKSGNKMYEMKVKVEKNTIIFRDSFNLMPMSLAALVPSFGLEVEDKPYFPHLANKPSNYEKEIFPTKADYLADGMMPEKRRLFDIWFEENKNKPFILDEALGSYCINDVEILMAALVSFRKEFMEISNGMDVLRSSMTIASACMNYFRTNHLKQHQLGIVPERGYDNATNQSRIALRFLQWYAEEENIDIRTALSEEGEKEVAGYHLDGWVEDKKLGLEVNGCVWHGCKECYPEDSILLPNGKTAGKVREQDERRIEKIESKGIEVKIFWECEIRELLKRDRRMREKFNSYIDDGPLDIRSCFFGGRTGPTKLFY